MTRIVRQERLDDGKRARLVEAAVQEFSERGFEAASYNKIIERSGLSKGTVYYYFDNKDSLLCTVLDEICERFVAAIGEPKLPDTKEEYWKTAWEYHKRAIQFFLENPSLTRVMFLLSRQGPDPRFDERLQAAHDRSSDYMGRLLARGQEIGAVRDDLPLDTILLLMQAMGNVLNAALLGRWAGNEADDEAVHAQVKKFMTTMHDLSERVLTPGTDGKTILER